jgi:microcystin-dependent protein
MNLLLNAEEITIFSIAAHPDGWETCSDVCVQMMKNTLLF